MSQVLTSPVSVTVTPPATPWRSMAALARFESVRLLRHPVSIGAVLLFLGPWAYGWATGTVSAYPVLHTDVSFAQLLAMLTVGAGAMIVANLAALRPHRHHTAALYDVLALPARWRTGALLLALVPYAGIVALVVVSHAVILALRPGAAGRLDPAELLTTPVVVVLLGAVGVLLARVVRSTVVGLLATLVVAVLAFAAVNFSVTRVSVRWLLPVVLPSDVVPGALSEQAATWHLLYLVGLTALVAVAALARSGGVPPGIRPDVAGSGGARLGVRRRGLAVGAGLALVPLVGGGVTQFVPDDAVRHARAAAIDDPAPMQTCRRIGDVSYCAFSDFTRWIDGWDGVLRGVRRAVPADVAVGPALVVRQRFDLPERQETGFDSAMSESDPSRQREKWRRADAAAGTPEAVTVGLSWGDGRSEAAMAAGVAYRLMTGRGSSGDGLVCGARGALLVWLAGQATLESASGLREFDGSSWGALVFGFDSLGGLSVPDPDAAAGLALLDKPVAEATALVRQHWRELTAPGTDAARFAALVGVPAAAQPPAEERPTCDG